jgi:hypothetical protein
MVRDGQRRYTPFYNGAPVTDVNGEPLRIAP